jgi:1-phosphofructokinase family hexose kinase
MIYTLTLNPAVDRELIVPAIEFDSVLRATAWRVDYGGKGFNVSRMLASLGTPSMALGFAGGRSGELLGDGLAGLGIKTDFVWVQGETRTNVSIVSEAHDHYVKANEPGPVISASKQRELVDKISALAQPGDWWVLAGSLPPGVPDGIYAQIIRILRESGAYAVLDTSGGALVTGCEARPYLVKPNALEAHHLTALPVDDLIEITAAAVAIQARGVPQVVISLGKDGAILTDGQNAWLASSPPVEELNPIGAGVSMVAGLVWGLSQGYAPAEALKWGVACGAGAASLSGTEVGSYDLVASLAAQVIIRAVPVTVG